MKSGVGDEKKKQENPSNSLYTSLYVHILLHFFLVFFPFSVQNWLPHFSPISTENNPQCHDQTLQHCQQQKYQKKKKEKNNSPPTMQQMDVLCHQLIKQIRRQLHKQNGY